MSSNVGLNEKHTHNQAKTSPEKRYLAGFSTRHISGRRDLTGCRLPGSFEPAPHINMVIHVSFSRELLMRPPWHRVKPRQPPQLMHIHVLLYLSSPSLCLPLFHHFFFFFLRAMWPFSVLSQSPSLWRSPTPAASCSCRGWHAGCRGSSRWHCSSGRGTRAGFSWPSTSRSRRAWSGCTSVTPDCACRLAGRARPSWSSAQVRSTCGFGVHLMFMGSEVWIQVDTVQMVLIEKHVHCSELLLIFLSCCIRQNSQKMSLRSLWARG